MATAGRKDDQEKPDMDLLSPYALEKVAQVMTFGKKKYGANNWRGGIAYSRLLAAIMRHLNSYRKGETLDPETGLSHLAHASCGLMMLLEFEETRPDLDDRYKSESKKSVKTEDAVVLFHAAEEAHKNIEKRFAKPKFLPGDIVRHIGNDAEVTVEATYFEEAGKPVLFVKDTDGKIYGVDPTFYRSIYVE